MLSEGLYQSPHKAIEELASNSYDAGATRVCVVSPRNGSDSPTQQDSLWVVDDGTGMDEAGFRQLWRVADSPKGATAGPGGRLPIGQFGIGKLAAYVLAWRLTHISKNGGRFFYTSMDFHQVEGSHQNDPSPQPVSVGLHIVDEARARELLGEVEHRDPAAWDMLFGPEAVESWTAAALSEFKNLFEKFRPGILGWVLRTGLPLVTDFSITLDGEQLRPAKEDAPVLTTIQVGGPEDQAAVKMGFTVSDTGITIPGIEGEITGHATLYERPLTSGKSLQYGRSHGFFIRVRGRVINLEDELFGLGALNHATWSRFAMEIEADGLRHHLLSSREGVRDSEPTYELREYLRARFNTCRTVYEAERQQELVGLDIKVLLKDASPSVLSDPLVAAVRQALKEVRQPSHYIAAPTNLSDEERAEWFDVFVAEVAAQPFAALSVEQMGPYDRLAEYDARTRTLHVNEDHPFVAKLLAHSKNQTPATLFATSEVLMDAFLREAGIEPETSSELFLLRDRALRQIAGDYGPDAVEVLRHLSVADQDKDALERAVGEAFLVMGFQYERRGGNKGGPDGVLDARLGRGEARLEDFRVVYDAKTTSGSSIAVDKVHFDALWDFKTTETADFAFIIGKKFDGEGDETAAVNRRADQGREDRPMTVLRTQDLRRLVELHYRYGVTMTQIRHLFENALTVMEVDREIDELENELSRSQPPVPLKRLLLGLEAAKSDAKSRPNVNAVRATDDRLKSYEPERLTAALQAVQTIVGQRWIEVNQVSGDVRMTQTAENILTEVERRLVDDLGLTPEPGPA